MDNLLLEQFSVAIKIVPRLTQDQYTGIIDVLKAYYGHAGRPGLVGGSSPRSGPAGGSVHSPVRGGDGVVAGTTTHFLPDNLPRSAAAAPIELTKQSLAWKRKILTKEEKSVLKDWTNNWYKAIRTSFERGEDNFYTKNFLSAIETAPKIENLITYRGLELSDKQLQELKNKVGKSIDWKSPSSTTISPEVATRFGNVIFEIKSKKQVYINAAAASFGKTRKEDDEYECIMPITKMRVLKVFRGVVKDFDGNDYETWIVQVEDFDQ